MIGLSTFDVAMPSTVEEAVRLLAEAGPEGRALAGGTDLLVNLKHRFETARLLVSVSDLDELRGVREDDGALLIGAGERLADLVRSPLVQARAPALVQACRAVAHTQAREMGTIGGNVCLDVRCRYVNQTRAWRGALGGCLKAEGDACHVVPGGKNCVAALSGDTLAPLVALDAEAEVVGPSGRRWVPVTDLRGKDGREPMTLAPGELLTVIRVPRSPEGRRSAYHKWAVRKAVDFPLVSVALVCDLDGEGRIGELRVAASVLGPRPRRVTGLERFVGEPLGPGLARAVEERVCRQCTPLPNVLYDAPYRRRLLGVLVRRQLEAWAAAQTPSDP